MTLLFVAIILAAALTFDDFDPPGPRFAASDAARDAARADYTA